MKVRNSERTTTQESQESQNVPKGAGKSPRGVSASADSVEMTPAAKGKTETSGQRELTADEQAKAPTIDPENFTSLQTGTDPRAALEGSKPFSQYKQPSPRGTGTLPNGQSGFNVRDQSQYNVQTNSAPSLDLKGAMGQIGSRGEKLKALTGNMGDNLDAFTFKGNNSSQGAASYLGKAGIASDPFFGANPVTPDAGDHHKYHGTPELIRKGQIGPSYVDWRINGGKINGKPAPDPTANAQYIMPDGKVVNASELTPDQKVAAEQNIGKKTGDQETNTTNATPTGQKPDEGWFDRIVKLFTSSGATPAPSQPSNSGGTDPVKDPGAPDLDGSHGGSGGSGLIGPQIDGLFSGGQILQGMTGRGPGGGEVVNPSREDTGGGQGSFDDHGAFKARLGYDNSQYLIGQPEQEGEQGFNGLSGSGNPTGNGGAIDYEDKSGWTGSTRTEEPGQVNLTPGGDGQLGHLIQNNDDDDEGRK